MLLKRRTTSPLDIVQKLTLTRRRVVRVVLLIGDTQVCVLPYVLQRSLIANFQTYCTSSMHAIALAPIMEFNDHASLATPQQLQHTITPLHPSLDPYPSGTSRFRQLIYRCLQTPPSKFGERTFDRVLSLHYYSE